MNKAIHQLTYTQDRDDVNDRFYVVRSSTDYQIPGTAFPPKLNIATRLITTAQVLALYDTPLEIVPAAPTGFIHYPIRGLIEFGGGSTDYATNTQLKIVSTTDPILTVSTTDSTTTLIGILKLTPQDDPPVSASEGMIYADTDHHLYYYNGTAWVQLD